MSLVGQPVEDTSGEVSTTSTQRRRLSSAATTPFRRSLNLTYGASALLARRFSRSRSNAAETTAPQPSPVRQQQRRSTISTTTVPPTAAAAAAAANQQQQPVLHVRIVPNIEDPSRSLIFDIVDRELSAGTIIKIGRFAERSQSPNHMSFKSKVVSRAHCEVWVDLDGKLYIRDTKSSSGTFLNHIRLSPANQESSATEIKHGDIVQLGVDYQGGEEEIYRSVKMRFEISTSRRPRPLSFSMAQFNNLRTLSRMASNHEEDLVASPMVLTEEPEQSKDTAEEAKHAPTNHPCASGDMAEVDECCICLYALAPFQALFVAPCSHSFHFKCIRSLLQSYPGFQCPICRTYSDLEASVAIEPEEVMEKYGLKCKSFTPPTDVMFDAAWSQPANPALQQLASDITSSSSSSTSSSAQSSSSHAAQSAQESQQERSEDQEQEQTSQQQHQQQQQHSDEEVQDSLSADQPPVQLQETQVAIDQQVATEGMSQEVPNEVRDRQRTVFVSDNVQVQDIPQAPAPCDNTAPTGPTNTGPGPEQTRTGASERRLSAANLVGKLKLNFFEKRKSMNEHHQQPSQQQPQLRSRKRAAKARPLSYPNFLMRPFNYRDDSNSNSNNSSNNNECGTCSDLSTASSSSQQRSVTLQSALTSNTLSRQSTTHLAEIEEEEPDELQRHIHHQPMEVDT